jgi:N utilization substance protein B
MRRRTRGREAALRALYQIDVTREAPDEVLREFWEKSSLGVDVRSFVEQIVRGVVGERAVLDRLINEVSANWSVERMSVIDRNILRMAVFELMCMPEIPRKVAINEAIELAKMYGAEGSPAFINGILDPVSKDLLGAHSGEAE